jgi:hypothetical protein
LAELYRVVDLLGQSGLALDTDMGMTDEGDPWFAFCRPDTGDVIFHIARIGRQYIAASGVIDRTCEGGNFRDIIDQLVRQQPLVMPRPTPNGKLFLHPAAVLAAFVAMALLHAHQAEAADVVGSAIPVTLDTPDQGASGGHKLLDGLAGLAKFFHVDGAKVGNDKVLAKLFASSEQASSLSTLIAVAYAAIAPLATQDVATQSSMDALGASAPPVHQATADTVLVSSDPAGDGLYRVSLASHDTGSHLDDGQSSPNDPIVHQILNLSPVTSPISLTSAVEVQKSDLVPLAVSQGGPVSDGALTHVAVHQTVITVVSSTGGTVATAASAQSTAVASGIGQDQTHHVDISTVDPLALSVLLPHVEATGAKSTASVTSASQPAGGGDLGGGTSGTATPLIQVTTATDLLDTLSSFASSSQHGITGALTPSSALVSFLSNYAATNGSTVEMIVFDSSAISLKMFPYVKGVVIVDDHQLSSGTQGIHAVSPVNVEFSDGGMMQLVGIITIDPNHPLGGVL